MTDKTEESNDDKMSLVSPIWVIAAAELGKGILAWVGTKIAEEIFGKYFNNDLGRLSDDVIRQFNLIVKKALDESRLTTLKSLLFALQTNIQEWNVSKSDKAFFRLETAVIDSGKIVAELQSLGLMAYPSWLIAASTRVLILQELYFYLKDKREIQNIRDRAGDFWGFSQDVWDELQQWSDARFEGPVKVVTFWYYKFNGQLVGGWPTENEAQRQMNIERQKSFNSDPGVSDLRSSLENFSRSMQSLIMKLDRKEWPPSP